MSENRRYFWIKLHKDFFKSKRIKLMRRLAGGDTLTIIYLKMQLLSLEDGGMLYYNGLLGTFAEELALDLDESPENVALAVNFLQTCGLMEKVSEKEYLLPFVKECTGSETSEAIKKRRQRDRLGTTAGQCPQIKGQCPPEIEREKEIEKEKSKSKKKTLAPSLESSEPAIISLTLNTGEKYPITQEDIENFKKLYPAVDVLQQFRNMCGWLDANPTKRKTRSGIKRFVNTWLAREQNDYHPGKQTQQSRYDAIAQWANERSSE